MQISAGVKGDAIETIRELESLSPNNEKVAALKKSNGL